MTFSCIVAMDAEQGIGKDNRLPWNLPKELAYFHRMTEGNPPPHTRNAVVMGRKTWESIPESRRPLPRRLNVVLTRNPHASLPDGVLYGASLDDVLHSLEGRGDVYEVFVIGGGTVFCEAFQHAACRKLYITVLEKSFDCDTFLPSIPEDFLLTHESDVQEEKGIRYRFRIYERKRHGRT